MSDNWLFRVCHEDGREWTRDETMEYLKNNFPFCRDFNSVLDLFSLTQEGNLAATSDEGTIILPSDIFKIVWNKERLEDFYAEAIESPLAKKIGRCERVYNWLKETYQKPYIFITGIKSDSPALGQDVCLTIYYRQKVLGPDDLPEHLKFSPQLEKKFIFCNLTEKEQFFFINTFYLGEDASQYIDTSYPSRHNNVIHLEWLEEEPKTNKWDSYYLS